jgi:hypothetical protein
MSQKKKWSASKKVETAPKELSIRCCCELLNINRSTLYYEAKPAEFSNSR